MNTVMIRWFQSLYDFGGQKADGFRQTEMDDKELV